MKNSNMKFTVIMTLVAVALLALIVVMSSKQDPETVEKETKEVDLAGQPVMGEIDAPVTLVEFGDYKCPSCKAWGEMIYPKLVEDYVLSGDVKFSFVNVLFHGEESVLGSLAGESVFKQSPKAYWDFHKSLFDAQPEENHDDKWITVDKLLEVAKAYPEINQEILRNDVEQEVTIDQVNIDEQLVKEHNVSQTPTIVINGITMADPFDYEAIKEVIDRDLEGNGNE